VIRKCVAFAATILAVLATRAAAAQVPSAPTAAAMSAREVRLPSGRVVRMYEIVVHEAGADSGVTADGTQWGRVGPARTFNVFYGTALPATEVAARREEAAELVALFAPHPPAANAGRLQAQLCDTPACIELRGQPGWIYTFERAENGSLRLTSDGPPKPAG